MADFMKENLWRGVTDRMERVFVAKRARNSAMNTDNSQEQQVQRQGPSGSRKLSPAPAEEEVGDD